MEENFKSKIESLEIRNKRVEVDKAWETSVCRKGTIFVLTYIVAALWLYQIGNESPLLNAFVPAMGWLLSTLTLVPLKRWWVSRNIK